MINFYVITAFVECSPNANLSQVSWDSSPWILQHWFVCPAAGAKMNGIIAKPCAVHFISICTSFLLTMWPWAEWGSWFTWGLLIFFCSFVGEQTQSSSQPNFESRNLWCLFANSCWNTMLHILFSLLCVKYIFSWFYQSIGFKGNNKYAKKGITSAMECADIASFTFAMWQIRLCLLCKFIRQEWQSF